MPKSKKSDTSGAETRGAFKPGWAWIEALGPRTREIVRQHLDESGSSSLFGPGEQDALKTLADALSQGWRDDNAAEVVTAYFEALRHGRKPDLSALSRWVLMHPDKPASVLDCMSIDPPQRISITKVLSRAGSQKLVFLATWRLTQAEVVLKRLIGPPEAAQRILDRELLIHQLSRVHPNIISTDVLTNSKGEAFLVEKYLPVLLDDRWRSDGVLEAANLLCDMSNALSFLHGNGLVHGDVKPDNIGMDRQAYILLDFGICRPSNEFTQADATATGSLRTRAPEILEANSYLTAEPPKVDVWALGATVYNALVGRFPLFKDGEAPPRVSHPQEREAFEAELARRSREDWESMVDLQRVPEPIRKLVGRALDKDPRRRCSAEQLMKQTEGELSAFVRRSSDVGRFSPLDELGQLERYLPSPEILGSMPVMRRQRLLERLGSLKNTHGFSADEKHRADMLLQRVEQR
jgi:serine/threonine protein kinase